MTLVGGLPIRISAERQLLHIVDPAMVKLSISWLLHESLCRRGRTGDPQGYR